MHASAKPLIIRGRFLVLLNASACFATFLHTSARRASRTVICVDQSRSFSPSYAVRPHKTTASLDPDSYGTQVASGTCEWSSGVNDILPNVSPARKMLCSCFKYVFVGLLAPKVKQRRPIASSRHNCTRKTESGRTRDTYVVDG